MIWSQGKKGNYQGSVEPDTQITQGSVSHVNLIKKWQEL